MQPFYQQFYLLTEGTYQESVFWTKQLIVTSYTADRAPVINYSILVRLPRPQ